MSKSRQDKIFINTLVESVIDINKKVTKLKRGKDSFKFLLVGRDSKGSAIVSYPLDLSCDPHQAISLLHDVIYDILDSMPNN